MTRQQRALGAQRTRTVHTHGRDATGRGQHALDGGPYVVNAVGADDKWQCGRVRAITRTEFG